jgi:hypothetical protein
MIRFLIGTLLAIAVLWASIITIGFVVLPFVPHANHQSVRR